MQTLDYSMMDALQETNALIHCNTGFPGSSAGKECACNARDPGVIPGLGRSAGEGIGYPLRYSDILTPVFWPGEFQGLYSPWGCKESDKTEQLSLSHIDIGVLDKI